MKIVRATVGIVGLGAFWVACSGADSPDEEDTQGVELALPTVDGGTGLVSSGSSTGSTGSGGGTSTDGGAGAAPACSCPVGPGEYVPKEYKNPCPAKTERTSCQAAHCTVAIGDPDDDEIDRLELRACSFPPPPPAPKGPCSCPVGQGEYLPDDTSTNHCPSKDNRDSCQSAYCKVMVGDPSDGLYDAIKLVHCTYPPPKPNPVGPCMCPVGAGEYLPDNGKNECAGVTTEGTCDTKWCSVAVGDPGDSKPDYHELRPCGWNGGAIVDAGAAVDASAGGQ